MSVRVRRHEYFLLCGALQRWVRRRTALVVGSGFTHPLARNVELPMRIHPLSRTIDRRTLVLLGVLGTIVLCVAAATIASAQGFDHRVGVHVDAVARMAHTLRHSIR